MSSKDPAKLIRSTNPNDRMQGVKMVARMQNERALRVLMQLSKNDENPEVRAFARKGAKYVARKLDEAGSLDVDHLQTQVKVDAIEDEEPAPVEEDVPEEEQGPVEINPKLVERAQGYLNEATDHHMNGNNDKAVKALSKAMDVNPNLRFDEYYKSLATSVTGMDGADAIRSLTSSRKRQVLIDADKQKKVAAGLDEHMSEANKHSWGTLGIDFGILSAIVFFGAFVSVLMVNYTGNLWVNGSIAAAAEARVEENISEEDLEAALIREVRAQAVGELLPVFNVTLALVSAVGALLLTLASVLANGFFNHLVAKGLGGEGTMHYLMYNIIGAYQLPLIVMYGVYMFGLVLMFLVGMPFAIVGIGLAGIGGLILLVMSIRLTQRIGRSYYGLGFGKAYLTQLIAGIPVGIVLAIVIFVVGLLVSTLAAPVFEAIPADALQVGSGT